MKTTVRAKLVAVQEGVYTNYVFQNLEEAENSKYRYITVTKCPNWQYNNKIKIGNVGFLEYEFAEEGQTYLDHTTEKIQTYKYTAFYFMNFIKEEKKDNQKEFNF